MDSVAYFEIPYDDQPRAQKFYEELFGWKIAKDPEMDYYHAITAETDPQTMMPNQPGAINGGMMKRQHPEMKPVIVIKVKSLDGHLKKAEVSGGKIVLPKIQVGEYGFYAQISDTEGNTIGMWQNAAQS